MLLGSTPRTYLHDLFADHTDLVNQTDHSENGQVSAQSFTCDINDLVATSPFTETIATIEFETPAIYTSFNLSFTVRIITCTVPYTALRGPPALA